MTEQMELGEKAIGVCTFCGAKKLEYKFGFNKGLAAVLKRIYESEGPAQLKDLRLTNSQYSNAPKIRYWGLAEQITGELMNARRGGCWKITPLGIAFIEGRMSVVKHAVVCRNILQRFEGPIIRFADVHDGYAYQQDYKDQASEQISQR